MRKKLWKILPLVTGLVLLTASSALIVHGESDNTIDVTLFNGSFYRHGRKTLYFP